MTKDDEAYLALLSWYVNASDGDLERFRVTRPEILSLAREYLSAERDEELTAIGQRLITALGSSRSHGNVRGHHGEAAMCQFAKAALADLEEKKTAAVRDGNFEEYGKAEYRARFIRDNFL